MQRLKSEEMLDLVKASLEYHDRGKRSGMNCIFFLYRVIVCDHVCLLIIIISIDLMFFFFFLFFFSKRTCTVRLAVVLSTVVLHVCMAIFDIGRSLVYVPVHTCVCCTAQHIFSVTCSL